jgi:uncharacterized protein
MDKGINKILDEFVKQSNSFLLADEIILYGSYARGNEREDSDIDVAVIVNEFSGDFLDAWAKLFFIVSKIDYRIEPVLLIRTNDKPGFIDHIKSYGKQLYSSQN